MMKVRSCTFRMCCMEQQAIQLQCPRPFADMDHRIRQDNVLIQVRSDMRTKSTTVCLLQPEIPLEPLCAPRHGSPG